MQLADFQNEKHEREKIGLEIEPEQGASVFKTKALEEMAESSSNSITEFRVCR